MIRLALAVLIQAERLYRHVRGLDQCAFSRFRLWRGEHDAKHGRTRPFDDFIRELREEQAE